MLSRASRSAARACRTCPSMTALLLTALLGAAASLPTAAASVMPVGFTSNATFSLANPSSTVQWSSEPLRIPNFLIVDGLDDGIEYSISNLTGPLEAFSQGPKVGSDYSLLLSFANDRLGGSSTSLSRCRAFEHLCLPSTFPPPPSNETVIVASKPLSNYSLVIICPI